MTVLLAGSANLDFVVLAPHIPVPGETVLGREFRTYPGGKGANQAVACARAGAVPTQMLLALGSDVHAAVIESSLASAGVELFIVRVPQLPTGTAFICVADDAQNAITVAPGANAALGAQDLPGLRGVSHLLLQLETPLPTVTAYAQAARAAGVQVVLNAAPAQPLPAALLEAIDILVVNQGELEVITGVAGDLDAALARLRPPTVVVTLGAQGCLARHQGELLRVPAFAVAALDTTAAGDTFCGALVAALSQGSELPAALRRASAAAAIACTRLGAQASIPARTEVDAFLLARAATP